MFNKSNGLFEHLVHAYTAELYRYAYWMCRDRFTAEELVQETYARAWAALEKLRDESAAKSWLYRILRNEHARLFERKRLDISTDVDLDSLEGRPLGDISTDLELREALHRLPEAYREPLVLQVLGGFSCDEIAEILSTTTGAVMTRLSCARMTLRRTLSGTEKEASHGMS